MPNGGLCATLVGDDLVVLFRNVRLWVMQQGARKAYANVGYRLTQSCKLFHILGLNPDRPHHKSYQNDAEPH